MHHPPPFKMFFTVQNIVSTTPGNHCSTFSLYVLWCPSLKWWWIGLIDSKIKSEKLPVKMFLCKDKLVLALWDRLANELLVVSRILIQLQEAMENFVFPDKCSFMLIAMTKSLNKSTVDQQTLQSLWGCLGDNHWAQSVLRSLSMDRQIKTDQIFHIWDCRRGPKASFIKGVERGISNIANYSIVRLSLLPWMWCLTRLSE